MSFKKVKRHYGNGVDKTIEMHLNAPCVDGPYNGKEGDYIAAVDIMPSEFDSEKCIGCDLYEICAKLDKLHQILNDHSLGPVDSD